MNRFEQLREKHVEFIYESYEINDDSFVFHFRMDSHCFSPKWSFTPELIKNAQNKELLEYAVFSLGIRTCQLLEMCLPSNGKNKLRST